VVGAQQQLIRFGTMREIVHVQASGTRNLGGAELGACIPCRVADHLLRRFQSCRRPKGRGCGWVAALPLTRTLSFVCRLGSAGETRDPAAAAPVPCMFELLATSVANRSPPCLPLSPLAILRSNQIGAKFWEVGDAFRRLAIGVQTFPPISALTRALLCRSAVGHLR
jgi:hypothetical protein